MFAETLKTKTKSWLRTNVIIWNEKNNNKKQQLQQINIAAYNCIVQTRKWIRPTLIAKLINLVEIQPGTSDFAVFNI